MTTTIRWFFSLGTISSPANYVLTPEIERVRPLFPSMARGSTAEAGWDASGQPARSTTAGLLGLLGPPRAGVDVRFHFFPTEKLITEGHFERCIDDAPDWAKSRLGRCRATKALTDPGPRTVRLIVDRILRTCKPGDLVLLDTTGGFRPFSTGVTLSQSVLRAMRPDVRILAAVYAELRGWQRAGAVDLSPIHDMTEFMDLPAWASAADDLRRRLDTASLATLLADKKPTVGAALLDAAAYLDLGWPDDLVDPLRTAVARIRRLRLPAGRREVAGLAWGALNALGAGMPATSQGPLDDARVRFHFDVAQFLARGGRYGDSLRVLRECFVDAAVLALAGGAAVAYPQWTEPKVRRQAEASLHRAELALQTAWRRVANLRNATSHAKASSQHLATTIAAVRAEFADEQILRDSESVLFPVVGLRPVTGGEWWFVGPTVAPPSDAAGHTVVEATAGPRSGSWLQKQVKAARAAGEACLALPGNTADLLLLASALGQAGITVWAIDGERRVRIEVHT